ncbi:MAG: hypothetical protein JNL75_08715 [Chitinophagales bacterium]|nr:hypothetical protein [Chitinophagales bacterium]
MNSFKLVVLITFIYSCSKEPKVQKSEFSGKWDGNITYITQFSTYTTSVFVSVNDAGDVTGTYQYFNLERKITGKVYENGVWNMIITGYGDKGNISGLTKNKKKFEGTFFLTDLSSDVYEGGIYLFKN